MRPYSLVILFLSSYILFSCSLPPKYLFFLHNRFIENNPLEVDHPQYGRAEYKEIIEKFEKAGLEVISEKRAVNTDVKTYAMDVVTQIDSLIRIGVSPNDITVVGTSKGGFIAQYVSTYLANPKVNFVFIGSFQESDLENYPDINFCGNILTIYEASDAYGVSALRRKKTSKLPITRFREIELNTQLNHGFLFKTMDEWMIPTINWANGNYDFEEQKSPIDAIITSRPNQPFNGIILIEKDGETQFLKGNGYADIE